MINFLTTEKGWEQITIVSLLFATLSQWYGLFFIKSEKIFFMSRTNLLFSNFTIAAVLFLRWLSTYHFPLSNLYESLLFLGWALSFVTFLIEIKSNVRIIGAIGAPMSMIVISFATLSLSPDLQNGNPLVPALKSNWLMMHVSVMIISYAILMIGSLLSIVFLVITEGSAYRSKSDFAKPILISSTNNQQDTDTAAIKLCQDISVFKKNRVTLLESLDNLSYRSIGLGFPLLTIGIISGAVWANEAWGTYWSWDPKETWALITWLVFAAYLHARINRSWQGKRPALLASIGFVVVWVCYLGVNFLGKGLHSYGWLS